MTPKIRFTRRFMCRFIYIACLPALLTSCPSENPLEDVRTFSYWGGDQRNGSIQYNESPPAGGPHNALWQNCGTYRKPLYNEYAVHTLARGAIWITYKPSSVLPEQRNQLEQLFISNAPNTENDASTDNSPIPYLMSPLLKQPSPIVITAWNAQLAVETADDPRLAAFVQQYSQAETPYKGAGCQNGFKRTR